MAVLWWGDGFEDFGVVFVVCFGGDGECGGVLPLGHGVRVSIVVFVLVLVSGTRHCLSGLPFMLVGYVFMCFLVLGVFSVVATSSRLPGLFGSRAPARRPSPSPLGGSGRVDRYSRRYVPRD